MLGALALLGFSALLVAGLNGSFFVANAANEECQVIYANGEPDYCVCGTSEEVAAAVKLVTAQRDAYDASHADRDPEGLIIPTVVMIDRRWHFSTMDNPR